MTTNSNTCNETQLSDEELSLVVGGASLVAVGGPTLANPAMLASEKLSPIYSWHLGGVG